MEQGNEKSLRDKLLPHKDDTYHQRDAKAAGLTFLAGLTHGVIEEFTGGVSREYDYDLLGTEHIVGAGVAGVVGMGISASKTQEHIDGIIPPGHPGSKAVIGGVRYLLVPGLGSGLSYGLGVGVGRLTTALTKEYLLK